MQNTINGGVLLNKISPDPIMIAAEEGQTECCIFLVQQGSKPTLAIQMALLSNKINNDLKLNIINQMIKLGGDLHFALGTLILISNIRSEIFKVQTLQLIELLINKNLTNIDKIGTFTVRQSKFWQTFLPNLEKIELNKYLTDNNLNLKYGDVSKI